MPNIFTQWIDEIVVEGKNLGRHIVHDDRSRDFDINKVLPRSFSKVAIRTNILKRRVPAWDQGAIGDCVGNSVAGLLMTDPFFKPGLNLTENDAVQIYSLATKLDPFPGSYPPDDGGTDGLDGMKAAKQLGYIFAYYHIFDFNTLLRYLSWVGPVIFGFNWYDSMDHPDSSGLCKVNPGAIVRGGHEVEIIGIDNVAKTIRFCNSWGPSWGNFGCGQISWVDFQRLMSELGDITVAIKNR